MLYSLSETPEEIDESEAPSRIRSYSFDHASEISQKNPLIRNKGNIIRETWFRDTSLTDNRKLMDSQDKMVWRSTRNMMSSLNQSNNFIFFMSGKQKGGQSFGHNMPDKSPIKSKKLGKFSKEISRCSKEIDSPAILRLMRYRAANEVEDFSHSPSIPK